MESFRLNSKVASDDREYLIQTVNDASSHKIRSTIFSNGQMLETFEEEFVPNIQQEELLELVKTTHNERREEVEQLFERFEEAVQSDDYELVNCLGVALMYKRMFAEAETLFRHAVSLKEDADEAYCDLGQVLFLTGDMAGATQAFETCVKLNPDFADYRNFLGEAYLESRSCKAAMAELDRAVDLNVYYGDAYYNKALAYILNSITREDFKLFSEAGDKVPEMLERAVVICPEFKCAEFETGKTLLADGDLEGGFAKLRAAREKKRQARRREFANIYLKFLLYADRIDEKILTRRIKSLKDAISRNPHYPDLHYDLAVAYTLMGRFIHSKAIQEYKEALKINPEYDRAKRSLRLAENEFRGFEALVKAITKG